MRGIKIELKRIDLTKLLHILDQLIGNRKNKRGRPPIYKESLIYFALAVKLLFKLSWRDLEYNLSFILKDQKIPDHTTLFYRANQIDRETLQKCIIYISIQIIAKVGKIDKLIVDGTGFGYNDTYRLMWERGKRLKEVKSHIKTEVLAFVKGKTTVPIAVKVGEPYSDERKLFKEILKETSLDEGSYIIGDRLYGMDSQLAKLLLEEYKLTPVIPVKDGIRKRIRDPYMRKLKEIYEDNKEVYRERYKIEQLIGKIKNVYGDRDNTKSYNLACVFVLMRFLLYNIALLITLFILLLRFFKQAPTFY